MAVENLEVVRQRFEAWERADLEAINASNHPEIELVTDPSWPEAGTYRGDAEVRRFYERYLESWQQSGEVDFELIPAGDKVLARWRTPVTGHHSGVAVENRATSVFTVREGQVTRIEYFFDHDEALRAAGLGGA